MKEKNLIYVLLGVMLVLVSASTLWAQPEKIVIKNPEVFKHAQRPAVTFPHERHLADLECLDCHHRYDKGENVLDEDTLEEGNADIRCASCHNLNARLGLRHAYHRKCTGCHTKMVKEGKKTGPRTCGGCHVVQ